MDLVSTEPQEEKESFDIKAAGKTVGLWAGIGVVALIVAMIIAAVVPRWWAQTMGDVIQERIFYGFWVGMLVGFVFTVLPLISIYYAWRAREKKGLSIFLVILGAILAIPNLMTLWITLGAGSAAHAGQRILDVEGPGFRGGSLTGALIGAALLLFLFFWFKGAEKRKERKAARKAAEKAAKAQAKAEAKAERQRAKEQRATEADEAKSDEA